MPTKTHDGDSDGPDHISETKTPARKSRSTASGSSRKSTAKTPRVRGASKAALKEVEEEEEEAPPATVKKAKRTTSKSRAKSIAPDKDDDAEEPPATLKKKGTRSKSVARSVASEVEDELPVAPPTIAKKKKAKQTRSRSKSAAQSEKTEQSDQDSEAPIVEETAKKPTRPKGKAKAPAPSETEEEEEEPVPRKSSRAKNKRAPSTVKKASSKSKSKAKVIETDEEEEEQETVEEEPEPPKPRTARKPPSTSSKATKSRSKPAQQQDESEEVSEDEFGPVIEQPHFAPAVVAKGRSSSKPPSTAGKQPLAGASSLGKGKPPTSRAKPPSTSPGQPPSSIDDEDEFGGYSSAPSSPPPPPPPPQAAVIPEANDGEEDMEMTPLVIPKRAKKPPQSATREIQEIAREQSESSSDTVKSTAKPRAVAKSVRQSQAGKPAAEKVRASITKVHDTSRMKVVDVLSSDDDFDDAMDALLQPDSPPEVVPEPPVEEEVRVDLQAKTKGKGKRGAAQAKKSLMFTTSSALLEEPMQLTAPVRSTAHTRPLSRASKESNSPEPQEDNAVDGDISMQEVPAMSDEGADPSGMDRDTKMEDPIPPAIETPRTSPQPASSIPGQPTRNVTTPPATKPSVPPPQSNDKRISRPAEVRGEEKQPQGPAFFPPLSKLPFVPIQELTGAELDMTVEEWIRYQMEVEYDKFRRDGERELQRFRKRAEEARKIIEGL